MKTTEMREKLQAYIGIAEKEKVKAMYTLLEAWIEEPVDNGEGYLSDALVAEMDAEYEAIERGELKAFSIEEVEQRLDAQRKAHYGTI